jgi:predicted O-linked N-acetylglucosamine transferase (SPINDLY family)
MTNIYIISNNKFYNNIKYIFTISQKLNPIFILNMDLIKTLPDNTYVLIFNKFYNPKKNFYNVLIDIINNDKGFHFLSKDNEIFITNNIKYDNNKIDIKKQCKYNIIFNIKSNNYEHLIVDNKEYTNEDIQILNEYYKSYNNIFTNNFSYDAYKKLYNEIMKDCYYIIYHIKDILDLVNLPQLTFYNYRLIITYTNLDVISFSCLKNFCKQNNYKYKKNKDILDNLNYLWFEKIIFMNNKSEINDTIINELNEMHKIFTFINKYNLKSINGDIIPYLYNLDIKLSSKSYPSNDIEYKLLYNKLIEAKLLNIKGYDKIYDELLTNPNKTKHINKIMSMSVLCNRMPPMQELALNIDNNNINVLYHWFLLLIEHKPTKDINYNSIIKNLGRNIIDIIINKDLMANNKNIITIITKIFDKLIFIIDKEVLIGLINISTYLHKYIPIEQIKQIILLLMPFISRFEITALFTKLLETIFPNFIYIDLLKIFPNNPSIIDLLIHITTHFSQSDNLNSNIFEKRQNIELNLIKLLEEDKIGKYTLAQILSLSPNNFYLSYHGVSSKNIFELKCKLFKKICPELNYKADFIDNKIKNNNKKIKVCFIASMLSRMHSVFKDRHQVIKHLSLNNNFDIYFMTLDELYIDVINEYGNAIHIKTERNLDKTKKKLLELQFDIIVYCEIGMDSYFYLLACMRFAKIQINTWGHSDTSGLDTIDYFFSSKLYELDYEEAQQHYSEKLILLNSLCTSYINPYTKYKNLIFNDRTHYGFNDSTIIYFCAQSIFKFNSIYYDYIIQIISSNPNAILLMMNNEQQSVFIKNLNHPIVSRIHWMPPMQHKDYMKLIKISDIILDTFPFGGCNSSLEAFSLGKVVVTQPGQMINGRFTKGFYEKMGLSNYIMNSKEDYIDFAIKLADKNYRELVEKEIIEKSNVLFQDKETITEWAEKLTELYHNHQNL